MTTTNTTDRRKYSIFSDAIKLLNPSTSSGGSDNDPNAIHPDNSEAGTNIMAPFTAQYTQALAVKGPTSLKCPEIGVVTWLEAGLCVP